MRRSFLEEGDAVLLLGIDTFKDRGPLDERSIPIDNGCDASRTPIVSNRPERFARLERIGPIKIGMRKQTFTNMSVTSREIPNGANGVTRFASLNMALVDALDPDRLAVEVANYAPNSLGRVINDNTVVDFIHDLISSLVHWP